MKDSVTKNKRNINYFFTSFALILLTISTLLAIHDFKLEQKAINIKATITTINYKQGKCHATIKYKVGQEVYRPNIVLDSAKYAVNDQIPIKYNIDKPSELIETNYYVVYIPGLIISLLILIFTMRTTIKNLKRSSNINHLKTKGIFVYADITDVYVDNKKNKKKGKHPYKLRCKYKNPKDDTEYIFESESSYLNFNEIFATYHNNVVIVFIDKHNTSNYYVDLDSLLPHIELVDVGALMGDKKEPKKEEEENIENKESTETNEKKDNPKTDTKSKEEKSQ